MADIRPFCAVRPDREYAAKIAALPYDVYKRKDALAEVTRQPLSFLHIDRPETWFDDSVDIYDPRVYEKARQVLEDWQEKGYFVHEDHPCYYIYRQTMDGRSQTGIVACASVNDYLHNVIKKHENTRASKEADRIRHIEACQAQTGPIFLAYRENHAIRQIVATVMERKPLYDFISPDGVASSVWKIDLCEEISTIRECFSKIASLYIADGHHRAASAVKVALRRREAVGLPKVSVAGDESDHFLCILFPDTDLKILPYNRVVRDLYGLSKAAFLLKISDTFNITALGVETPNRPFPDQKGSFGMYLEGQWYRLELKEEVCVDEDCVSALDVSVLQNYILGPILGIDDPRVDARIDFIGGIHGLEALERYCDSEGFAVAFAMYPTAMEELFAVADQGALMPPKSTWFEPKLRSGLFIHKI